MTKEKQIKFQVVVTYKIKHKHPVSKKEESTILSLGTPPFESYTDAERWINEFENSDQNKCEFSFCINKYWTLE